MAPSVTTWFIVRFRQVLVGANKQGRIKLRAGLPDQAKKAILICPNGYIAEATAGRRLINHSPSAVKSHILSTTGFIVSELTWIDRVEGAYGKSHILYIDVYSNIYVDYIISASVGGRLPWRQSRRILPGRRAMNVNGAGRPQSSCANAICFLHEKWIRWRAQTFWRMPNSIAQCKWSLTEYRRTEILSMDIKPWRRGRRSNGRPKRSIIPICIVNWSRCCANKQLQLCIHWTRKSKK